MTKMKFSPWRLGLALSTAPMALLASHVHAQITTDGSVGAAGSVSGPNYAIPQSLGRTNSSGTAVLQSFSQFQVNGGETATFSGSTNLNTIIARVTGGSAATINGQVNVTAPNANFYFIDPNGIVVGASGSFNVPAGLNLSTADKLNFTDGSFIDMTTGTGGTLSTAPLASFGFLGGGTGAITISGVSTNVSGTITRSGHGQATNLSLIGSNVSISDSFFSINDGGVLRQARYAAVGSGAGDINISGPIGFSGGNLTLSGMSAVAHADTYLSGGTITLQDSLTTAGVNTDIGLVVNSSLTSAPPVQAPSLYVTGQNANLTGLEYIQPYWFSTGSHYIPGSLNFNLSGDLTLDRAHVSMGATNLGAGASININAANLTLKNNAELSSYSYGGTGSQDGGNISVHTSGDVNIISGSVINTGAGNEGNAGNISINSANLIVEDSTISSVSSGTGAAGNITLKSDGDMTLGSTSSNARWGSTSLNTWSTHVGSTAGAITLTSGRNINFSSAVLGANNFGGGNAGPISLSANGTFTATILDIDASSAAPSTSLSVGRGGDIRIDADGGIDITSGFINSSSDISSAQTGSQAGNVTLHSFGDVKLTGGYISADTWELGSGHAGDVTITGRNIGLSALPTATRTGYYLIYAYSGAPGANGGKIGINATGTLSIDHTDLFVSPNNSANSSLIQLSSASDMRLDTSFLEQSYVTGYGIAIALNSGGKLDVVNTRFVNPSWFGGNGGDTNLTSVGNMTLTNSTFMASASNGSVTGTVGHGGNVTLNAGGDFTLNATGITRPIDTSGNGGGNLTISAQNIAIQGTNTNTGEGSTQEILSTRTTGTNRAGDININATGNTSIGGMFLSADTAASGDAANVNLNVGGLLTLTTGSKISSNNTRGAAATGHTGAIDIRAGSIQASNGNINTISMAAGVNSGTIRVQTTGNATFNNFGISTDGMFLNSANAGTINMNIGGALNLSNKAIISSASSGNGGGGGFLDLVANSISLSNSFIRTNSMGAGFSAGNIHIVTSNDLLSDASEISADSLDGSGGAGSLNLNIGGTLTLQNELTNAPSLSARSIGFNYVPSPGGPDSGNAGTINVTAQNFVMNNASMSVETTSRNTHAGTITTNLSGNALIGASALGSAYGIMANGLGGDGGAVNLNIGGNLYLNNAQISSEAFSGIGVLPAYQAGTVAVSARNITTQNSSLFADSDFRGGIVNVTSTETMNWNSSAIKVDGIFGGQANLNAGLNILSSQLEINADGSQAGKVSMVAGGDIHGDRLNINAGGYANNPSYAPHGGDIALSAGGAVQLIGGTGEGIIDVSSERGTTSGGNILIQGLTVSVDGPTTAPNDAFGLYADGGGTVAVKAGDLSIGNAIIGSVGANGLTSGAVQNANVTLLADRMTIGNGAMIVSGDKTVGANVVAGNITIGAGDFSMTGGEISTAGQSGGIISIGADQSLKISEGNILSQIASTSSANTSGNVYVGGAIDPTTPVNTACLATCQTHTPFASTPGTHSGIPVSYANTGITLAQGPVGAVILNIITAKPDTIASPVPATGSLTTIDIQTTESSDNPADKKSNEKPGRAYIAADSHVSGNAECRIQDTHVRHKSAYGLLLTGNMTEAPGTLTPKISGQKDSKPILAEAQSHNHPCDISASSYYYPTQNRAMR